MCAVTDIVSGRPTYLTKNNDTLRLLSEKSKLGIPLATLLQLNRELWLDIKGATRNGRGNGRANGWCNVRCDVTCGWTSKVR